MVAVGVCWDSTFMTVDFFESAEHSAVVQGKDKRLGMVTLEVFQDRLN